MVKVAIVIPEEISPTKNKTSSWLGGLNYYKNVISAVYKLPERKIEITVFVNSDASDEFAGQFSEAKVVRSSVVDVFHDETYLRRHPVKKISAYLLGKLFGRGYLLEKLFLKHQINVHSYGDPINSRSIKSICWIADFQQINHPEFFTSGDEVKERNKHIDLLIEKSDSLILSSETALNDLRKYKPEFASKARVLKFIPAIDLKAKLVPIEELRQRYQFEGDHFYLPNQIWKHKNHDIVVKAINEIVNVRGKNVLVLASGSLNDYRNMAHIEGLVSSIETLKLGDNLKLLGIIPYIDVLSLMHYSQALINPSFSEGWSSTVEEAKQLKVPLILSNIPIHQEQTRDTTNSVLFDPTDHLQLADILVNYKKKEFFELSFNYHNNFAVQQIKFGQTYQDIVLEVLNESSS